MGQVSSLTFLNLQINMLNGEVPQSIFNLSQLQLLAISSNNLSGRIPFSIDKGLPNIENLFIFSSKFKGQIPASISNLSRLTILELSGNSFGGDIPKTLGNLRQLPLLNLGENSFTNNMSEPEQDFLTSLTTCKYLKVLQVSNNPITGVLPISLGSSNLSASLEQFLASSCQIVGPFPSQIDNFSNLIWLKLRNNLLAGLIPVTLGHLESLQNLEIQENKLEGSISDVFCNLKYLYSINLAKNKISGPLPKCLGNLSLLRKIDFSGNGFSSSIPSTLWSIEQVEGMNSSYNFFDGSLSQNISNLKGMIELDLSRNQLSGKIPSTISQLQNLIILSLSNNKINGPILESFADSKSLEQLDLSNNNLSGTIPKSLEALSNLVYFNVSFNDLRGPIPNGGPFVNFTAAFFQGNKGLCGAPRFQVVACTSSATKSKNKLLKYILPAIISVVVVIVVVVILIMKYRNRKILPSNFVTKDIKMHERISYLDILRATSNLDEGNLIGRGGFGSVYKGSFSSTMVAAVKVFDLEVQDAVKSFDTECQIMRTIRHRNLVKIITSCSNLEFRALVMEYMPNGNLEKWLYMPNCGLNIFQRLGIMIDVASAMEYLHEGYTSPIIHCDLKPHNILLDEDMVARVGDFGIAKLFTQEQRIQQTRTLGTIGYMAPEYGSEGIISTMVDVYSYGILLMEIFSRRKPTDEIFSEDLTMRKIIFESFSSRIMQLVDDTLLNMDDESMRARHENCLTSIMELALKCTTDLPEERPTMKDVLVRMRKINLNLSNSN